MADDLDGSEECNLRAGLLRDYRVRSQVRILPGSAVRIRGAGSATPKTLNFRLACDRSPEVPPYAR